MIVCPCFLKTLLNFYNLRTSVAKFCRENLRTFSADFFGLKSEVRRHFYFLDVWPPSHRIWLNWIGYCYYLLPWPGCLPTSQADCCKAAHNHPSRTSWPPSVQQKKHIFIMLKVFHFLRKWNLEELARLEHHGGLKDVLCLDDHLHLDHLAPSTHLDNLHPLVSWEDILGLGDTPDPPWC